MKKLLLIFTVFAVACSSSDVRYYEPTSDARTFIIHDLFVEHPIYGFQAERNKHKDEILKTLIINEVIELGDLRAIFYSFSVGIDIARDTKWAVIVDGKLYDVFTPKYSMENLCEAYNINISDLKEIVSKEEHWELSPYTRWNF